MLAVIAPNLPCKPNTIMFNKVTIKGAKQAVQMFGPAQAAVARAVADSVQSGVIPVDEADDLFVAVGVFIHWQAADDNKIFDFNYRATKEALERAARAIELQFDYYGPFGFGAVVARLDEPMFDLTQKATAPVQSTRGAGLLFLWRSHGVCARRRDHRRQSCAVLLETNGNTITPLRQGPAAVQAKCGLPGLLRRDLLPRAQRLAAGRYSAPHHADDDGERPRPVGQASQIPAADRAFHGRRPASGRPVAGKKYARPGSGRGRTVGVNSRPRRVGRVQFLDDGGFHKIRAAGNGEEFADLLERQFDDFSPGFFDQRFR